MFSYDPFGYQTWDDLNLFAGEIKTVYPPLPRQKKKKKNLSKIRTKITVYAIFRLTQGQQRRNWVIFFQVPLKSSIDKKRPTLKKLQSFNQHKELT